MAAPSSCSIVAAIACSSGRSSFAISAATISLSEVDASCRAQLVAQLVGVDQVAVVPERDGARVAVVEQRLRVRPRVRAGGRVARVADRELAVQAGQVLLVEHLRDEAEVAQRREAAVLGDGDPGRLLAAVLERVQAEVGEPRDVAAGGVDAEDAAHQRRPTRRPAAAERGRRRAPVDELSQSCCSSRTLVALRTRR